jgi:large subunit ribosomal protein L19
MQCLVRNVCRAGSRGAAARLLELAAAGPGATQPSVAVKLLRPPYEFTRPIGVVQPVRVQSRAVSRDGLVPAAATSGFGLCAQVIVAMRGLSTVGSAAEVASDSDDSTSPAVEHPPRIKFKRPDKTARHIMNVCKLSECHVLAGAVLLHYITSHKSNKIATGTIKLLVVLAMQILNKEAVEKVRSEREIPDVQPGCIIQMRLVMSFFTFLLQPCYGHVSGIDPLV